MNCYTSLEWGLSDDTQLVKAMGYDAVIASPSIWIGRAAPAASAMLGGQKLKSCRSVVWGEMISNSPAVILI